MTDENQVEESNEESSEAAPLRDVIEAAFVEHEEVPIKEEKKDPAPKERSEDGKFKAAEDSTPALIKAAPAAWSGTKEEFAALPTTVQDRIIQREEEVHKGFTKLDEERNLGKSMKEIITPYMAIIQAEGGTPQGAVKDLLNTAYVLRTGSPQQKLQLMSQVAQQYGVDLRQLAQPQQQTMVDPNIQALYQKVQTLEQERNNSRLLQEQNDSAKVNNEIEAFAADTKNVHFTNPQVKARMASLLDSGNAKDLQDAYDQATWAVPDLRAELKAAERRLEDAARKEEIAAKKRAGSSLSGSPGISIPNSGKSDKSRREELEAAWSAHMG